MSEEERYVEPEPSGYEGDTGSAGVSDEDRVSQESGAYERGANAGAGAAAEAGQGAGAYAGSTTGPAGSSLRTGGDLAYAGSAATSEDRLFAALSWVFPVFFLIPLVSLFVLLVEPNRRRPLQRYHAVASMAFWVAAIVYEIIATVAYVILGVVTLGIGFACLWPIFFLPHVIALYYAYTAYVGREPEIPLISGFIRQQRWV